MRAWSQMCVAIGVLLLCFAAGTASAQDAGMSDMEIPADSRVKADDNVIFVPGEGMKYVPRPSSAVVSSDSISLQLQDFPMQRAVQRPEEKTAEKQSAKSKDESILTFNLLYYIIQKYKLQDIID